MTDEAVDQFLVFIQDTLDLGVPFAVLWDVRRESFPTMKHLRKVISWLDEGDRAAVWDSRVTCHYLVLRNPLVRAGIGLMARVANAPQPVRCASSDAEALVFAQACARPALVLSARDAEMRMHRPEPAAEVHSTSAQSAEAAVVQSTEAASAQSAEAASAQSAEAASAQSAEAAVVQSAEAAAQVVTGAHAVMDPRATSSPAGAPPSPCDDATSSPAGAPPSPCDDAPSLQHALPHETALHVPRHHDEAEAQRRTQIGGDEAEAQRRTRFGGDEAEAQRRIQIGGDEAEAQRRTQIGGDEAEAQRRIRFGQLELRWPRQRSGA